MWTCMSMYMYVRELVRELVRTWVCVCVSGMEDFGNYNLLVYDLSSIEQHLMDIFSKWNQEIYIYI